jgi:hypothetical protein
VIVKHNHFEYLIILKPRMYYTKIDRNKSDEKTLKKWRKAKVALVIILQLIIYNIIKFNKSKHLILLFIFNTLCFPLFNLIFVNIIEMVLFFLFVIYSK